MLYFIYFIIFFIFSGDAIIAKGTEGNVFYLIKEGTVRVTDVGDGKTFPAHNLGQGKNNKKNMRKIIKKHILRIISD